MMLQNTRITVHIKLAGPIDGRSLNISGTVALGRGDSLKRLFREADALLGEEGQRPFTRAFRQGVLPIVLVNGERIDFPGKKDRLLAEGDEVSIIVALGGG